jgi:hypothetical protein
MESTRQSPGSPAAKLRKLRTVVASVIVAATAVTTLNVQPAFAAYTVNLAGRPIGGDASTSCQGLAYGRAGGQLVLFTAAHCQGGTDAQRRAVSGTNVIGPNGQALGFWTYQGAGWDHDLTYIVLYSGMHPSALNQVFHGTGVSPGYWTITRNPSAALSCASLGSETPWGTGVSHNFQPTVTSNFIYTGGVITGFAYHPDSQHCLVQTNIGWNGPTDKDSGSSFILSGYTNTVFGIATSQDDTSLHRLQLNPLYEGLNDLNTYWAAQNHTGAWLCQTASC